MKAGAGARAILYCSAAFLVMFAAVLRPGITLEPPWWPLLVGGILAVLAGVGVFIVGVGSRAQASSICLLIFMGWIGLGWFLGGTLETYRSELCYSNWVAFAGIFFAILTGVRRREEWRFVAWLLVFTCMALSLYGLVQFRLQSQERLLSTFINADCFSLFPVCGLLLSLGLYHHTEKVGRYLVQANVFLQLPTLILSGSRAGMLGLIAGILMLALLLWWRTMKRSRRSMVDTFSPLFIGIILMGLGSVAMPSSGRWDRLFQGKEGEGIAMRQDVLSEGMHAIAHHPLFGSGPGTFSLAYQEYRPIGVLSQRMYVNVAHNDYVELGVESGLPALILWLILLVVVWERASRFARRSQLGHEVAATASAVTALACYSTLNFIVAVPADLFLLGALLALCVAPTQSGDIPPPDKKTYRFRLVVGGMLIICGLGSTSFAFRANWAYQLRKKGEDAIAHLQLEAAQESLEKSIKLMPERPEAYLRLAQAQLYFRELTGDSKYSEQALKNNELAFQWGARELSVPRALALAYSEAGRNDEAIGVLQQAIDKSPYFTQMRQDLARVYLRKGKIVEATAALAEVYARDDNNDNELRRRLGQLLALSEESKSGSVEKILKDCNMDLDKMEPLIADCSEYLLQNKKYIQADTIEKTWARMRGEDCCIWLQRSRIWKQAGDKQSRIQYLEKAVDESNVSSPCYEKALLEYTEAGLAVGKLKEVEARLTMLMNRNAGGTAACAALARMYLDQKNIQGARRLVSLGLEKQERDPKLMALRARIALMEGSPDSALEQAKIVLEIEPGNREASEVLAKAREQLNK